MLKTSDYNFHLPDELIAQYPKEKRDESKLLCLNRKTGEVHDDVFSSIIDELNTGDCLVVNNTKVIPARLLCKKTSTGAKIEVMLVRQINETRWEALLKPGKKAPEGTELELNGCKIIIGPLASDNGTRYIDFHHDSNVFEFIEKYGKEPLPPYIKRDSEEIDKSRYQTVFAQNKGAVAAPTAGLHFTDELLEKIRLKGIHITEVTLHVSLGTFRPVKVDDVTQHKMHSEYFQVSIETANLINKIRKNKTGRIICVGTTSMRTLESSVDDDGNLLAQKADTDIFIYPGYKFKLVDALITNFHTPESTLLMLVSAFAGYDNIMSAYRHAVEKLYRFFSYGDSMFIR